MLRHGWRRQHIVGMEAYKAIKECHNDRMQYAIMTYLVGKNKDRSKEAIHFSSLDVTLLNRVRGIEE